MIKKVSSILFFLGFLSFANATSEHNSAEDWRNGFITAYKAMKAETQLQGIDERIIPVKKYIIYFNANKDDVSDWDKLMVQMFGYSSSIYKPIRTKNNFLIFGSYDNKATAYQELDMLNDKIFNNSKKFTLEIMEHDEKKVFKADKALLASELKGLEKLLIEHNKILLEKKKRELEENQKVAIIYVDKNTGKVVNKNNNSSVSSVNKKSSKKGKVYIVKKHGVVLRDKNNEIVKTMKKGDRLRIIKVKNNIGKTSYGNFIDMDAFKKDVKTLTINKKKLNDKIEEIRKKNQKEDNPIVLNDDNGLIGQLFSTIKYTPYCFITSKTKNIDIYNFTKAGSVSLYEKPADISKIVYDKDGNIYYKLFGEQKFIKKSDNLSFMKLK